MLCPCRVIEAGWELSPVGGVALPADRPLDIAPAAIGPADGPHALNLHIRGGRISTKGLPSPHPCCSPSSRQMPPSPCPSSAPPHLAPRANRDVASKTTATLTLPLTLTPHLAPCANRDVPPGQRLGHLGHLHEADALEDAEYGGLEVEAVHVQAGDTTSEELAAHLGAVLNAKGLCKDGGWDQINISSWQRGCKKVSWYISLHGPP